MNMNNKLNILKLALISIINDIDSGNCSLSEDEMNSIIDTLQFVAEDKTKLSKYQACDYLNVSRATFDNLVKDGAISPGRQQVGFKEKF